MSDYCPNCGQRLRGAPCSIKGCLDVSTSLAYPDHFCEYHWRLIKEFDREWPAEVLRRAREDLARGIFWGKPPDGWRYQASSQGLPVDFAAAYNNLKWELVPDA